jgi:signal transduction histidine kinase
MGNKISKWKDKDHLWSAATGAFLVVAGFATAAAVTAVVAGSGAAIAALITVVVVATGMDFALKFAAQDNFKLGTCLGAVAVTAGTLTLAFNALFHKPAEKPKAPAAAPKALVESFKNSAAPNDKTVVFKMKPVSGSGIPATAFRSGG